MTNRKIVALAYGFYIYGTEVEAPEGYIKLINAAMFGGFSGGKGMPAVCRGDDSASVTLDKFGDNQEFIAPISSVIFIVDSVELYNFKGKKLR